MTIETPIAEVYVRQDAEIVRAQTIIREKINPWIEASKRHGLTIREGPPLASMIGDCYSNLKDILSRTPNYKLTDEMLEKAIAENPGINVKRYY